MDFGITSWRVSPTTMKIYSISDNWFKQVFQLHTHLYGILLFLQFLISSRRFVDFENTRQWWKEKFIDFLLLWFLKILQRCHHQISKSTERISWYVTGYYPPQQKYLLPVLKCFNLPSSSKFLLPPPNGNKKNEDVKLTHKSLIQHNSWQIKEQSGIWRNTVNLMQTLTFRLSIINGSNVKKVQTSSIDQSCKHWLCNVYLKK